MVMKNPSLLLFLQLEEVLALGGVTQRQQVEQTVCAIARGDSNWRDHHALWSRLFEPESVLQLKSLHAQFQPQYCLTSGWTGFMDKATTLIVLRLAGLAFVASNLHADWAIDRVPKGAARRSEEVAQWLLANSAYQHKWVLVDSDVCDPAIQDWPEELQAYSVFCCTNAGLTGFEAGELRKNFLRRLCANPASVQVA